jgi:hypothetical protein
MGLARLNTVPAGTISASPAASSCFSAATVASAMPLSATKISSRSTVCGAPSLPGAITSRHALVSCAPRLGEARPVTVMPGIVKVGASAALTSVIYSPRVDYQLWLIKSD